MTSLSWGRNPRLSHKQSLSPSWLENLDLPSLTDPLLVRGLGRSYGDCCLNEGGTVIRFDRMNRFISFDREHGILRAEAGVSLREILDYTVMHGWFIPVTPGTKYVTLGGAIANDVHGKNQTKDGTFGRHVRALELLRSNGERVTCDPQKNSELFRATIAGLGLTGVILWAEIQLVKVDGPYIDVETVPFEGLDQFFKVSESSEQSYRYTVAWLDCMAGGSGFGRGVFFRGNHSNKKLTKLNDKFTKSIKISVPLELPNFVLNRLSLSAFNFAYFNKNKLFPSRKTVHFDPFFYPLDSVGNWNLIYGKRGFYQFQCVVPQASREQGISSILDVIVRSRRPSFLGVLKCFGNLQSPGMLSFPMQGVTLCLDFPNEGKVTEELFRRLHALVLELGGKIYPAKDAWMTKREFESFYPVLEKFTEHIDPKFSSSLWRRVYA